MRLVALFAVVEVFRAQNPLVVALVEVRNSHVSGLVLYGTIIWDVVIFTPGSPQVKLCQSSELKREVASSFLTVDTPVVNIFGRQRARGTVFVKILACRSNMIFWDLRF